MSSIMLYPFRADAYVTAPPSEFVSLVLTRSIYRNSKSSKRATDSYLSQGRWSLRAYAGGRRHRLLKGGHPFLVLGQQMRQSPSLQFLIHVSFMPSGSPTFATISDSTWFAGTASSTVPAAPAQRAGPIRSWRETRALGLLSPTSRLDAGALGYGTCGAHDGSVTITVTTMADNDDNP
jgi:hypothetical protein